MELLSQCTDSFIDLSDIIIRMNVIIMIGIHHEMVVSDRLNLQIIIKIDQPGDFLFRTVLHNCTVQFPCTAGTSDNQSFPVLYQFTLGNQRKSLEVSQMRFTDQCIQMHSAECILRQNDAVMRPQMLYHFRRGYAECIDLRQILHIFFLHHGNEFQENKRSAFRIVYRTMMVLK